MNSYVIFREAEVKNMYPFERDHHSLEEAKDEILANIEKGYKGPFYIAKLTNKFTCQPKIIEEKV